MSLTAAQQLIQSLLLHANYQQQQPASNDEAIRSPLTITLSRDHGAGGCAVAQRLSERLQLPLWDSSILHRIADAAQVDPTLMAALDERMRQRRDAWMYNFLTGQNANITSYRHHLVNVLLGIREQGGIIIGRGAHLLLQGSRLLRLRIVGSVDRCAARLIARGEEADEPTARAAVIRVNREREQFISRTFGASLNCATDFDLIINSDPFNDNWDAMVTLLQCAVAVWDQ